MMRFEFLHPTIVASRLSLRVCAASVCLVAGAWLGIPASTLAKPADAPAVPQQLQASDMAEDVAFLERVSSAFSRVAKIAKPSVVSIRTLTPQGRGHARASGSGVIFDDRGHVVTSYHVIEDASQVDVILADGRRFRATIVGSDERTDVGVLRINATQLAPATFGDSSRVEVGHLVLAIGSPFQLAQTVSSGMVSATGRSDVDIPGMEYHNFIQTDAPTNPGNSGGALVNTRGEVIGINTAIAGSKTFSGVAFATPSNTVVWAARAIISGRPLVRGFLGVAISSISTQAADDLGLNTTEGVLIEEVTPGSPAARAGMMAEDIVTQIDNVRIVDCPQLQTIISELVPGEQSTIHVWRAGRQHRLNVVIGEQPRR